MAKVYTAQEMRQKAFVCELIGYDDTAAMLRQSADAMEKEKTGDCDEMTDSFVEIYNIANDSNEQNWRSCMEKIQDITRRFV